MGKEKNQCLISQLETLIKGMLSRRTLLDIIRHFIVFEKTKRKIRLQVLHLFKL